MADQTKEIHFVQDGSVVIPIERYTELVGIEALYRRASVIAETAPEDRYMSEVEKVLVLLLYPEDPQPAQTVEAPQPFSPATQVMQQQPLMQEDYIPRHAAPEGQHE